MNVLVKVLEVKINYESIRKKVRDAAQLKGRPIARKKAYNLFYRAKAKMLRRFDEDLITLEIAAGPSYGVANISGTLDGYGNLFSFLGFERSDKPIEAMRSLLDAATRWEGEPVFDGKSWLYRIFQPTREELANTTKLEWTSTPWIDFIEHGAPNINYYLNLKKADKSGLSRSKYGFQVAEEVNEDLDFKSRDYITDRILKNFRETINGSSIQNDNQQE